MTYGCFLVRLNQLVFLSPMPSFAEKLSARCYDENNKCHVGNTSAQYAVQKIPECGPKQSIILYAVNRGLCDSTMDKGKWLTNVFLCEGGGL